MSWSDSTKEPSGPNNWKGWEHRWDYIKKNKSPTDLPFWLELKITRNANQIFKPPSRSTFLLFISSDSTILYLGRKSQEPNRNCVFVYKYNQNLLTPDFMRGFHSLFVPPVLEQAVFSERLRSKQNQALQGVLPNAVRQCTICQASPRLVSPCLLKGYLLIEQKQYEL